jgi:phospholipase C
MGGGLARRLAIKLDEFSSVGLIGWRGATFAYIMGMGHKFRTTRRSVMRGLGSMAGAATLQGCVGDSLSASQTDNIIDYPESGSEQSMAFGQKALGRIEHIVVLMMENRSFDHMFGALSIEKGLVDAYGNPLGGEGRKDVRGLTGQEVNYDLDGNPHHPHRMTKEEYVMGDIAHEWEDCQRQAQYDPEGEWANDGFVKRHHEDVLKPHDPDLDDPSYCATYKYFGNQVGCPPVHAPMGVFTREELPVYYDLADNYTLCDNWFASVLGPTWPNRFFSHAGTAGGNMSNTPLLGYRTIWEIMRNDPGLKDRASKFGSPICANFYCDLPLAPTVGEGNILGSELGDGIFGGILEPFWKKGSAFFEGLTTNSFEEYVAEDKLPFFSMIDPGYAGGYDDHPPSDVGLGQAFVSLIYNMLAAHPKVWEKTLFIVTYDEHGSFYDHVVPPGPDATYNGKPMSQTFDEDPNFRRLGVRVPGIIIGPHARKGYVSRVPYEHCSILRTATDRWDLQEGYLNERVANSESFLDCLDGDVDKNNIPEPAAITTLEFSESQVMDWASQTFPNGQPGLDRELDLGRIDRRLDLRKNRVHHIAEMLQLGEKYGALKLKA